MMDRTPKIHYGVNLTRCGLSRGRGIKTQHWWDVNCKVCLRLAKEDALNGGIGRVHARKLEAMESPKGRGSSDAIPQ